MDVATKSRTLVLEAFFAGRVRGRGAFVNAWTGSRRGFSVDIWCQMDGPTLILDEDSRSDTYPTMEIDEEQVNIGHEASVSKLGEDQLFYLMSRGMGEDEAMAMIVRGFVEPIARELPMEYALELNRLIELQMEGAVG